MPGAPTPHEMAFRKRGGPLSPHNRHWDHYCLGFGIIGSFGGPKKLLPNRRAVGVQRGRDPLAGPEIPRRERFDDLVRFEDGNLPDGGGVQTTAQKKGRLPMKVVVLAALLGCRALHAGDPNGPQISGPYTHDNLSVFLIHGASADTAKHYITLKDAMEA